MGYKSPHKVCINLIASNMPVVADATAYYFSGYASAPDTIVNNFYSHIPVKGIVREISITSVSITAGSNEEWNLYLRINDTTDYLIAAVSASAVKRRWLNAGMNISVEPTDIFIIKSTPVTWATNPANLSFYGQMIVEVE
ncbi:MAG: hypothetical protein IMZ61_02965 [Planctomycetes bacterium]|nr:hypothetical protein [Planctomycetota bacterium]